jgi:hypothetical protein
LTDVTVIADAGMISETNQIAIQAAGLSYILGTRIPFLPDVVQERTAAATPHCCSFSNPVSHSGLKKL